MRITEKGQVTIPLKIRQKYGLLPHAEIEFVEDRGKIYIRKILGKSRRGQEIVKHLRGRATIKMTTDQIMKLTRDD